MVRRKVKSEQKRIDISSLVEQPFIKEPPHNEILNQQSIGQKRLRSVSPLDNNHDAARLKVEHDSTKLPIENLDMTGVAEDLDSIFPFTVSFYSILLYIYTNIM